MMRWATTMTTRFAWVIEHGNSTAAEPDYFAGFDAFKHFKWTRNHLDAVRFLREQDATAVARGDRLGDQHRVCEHGWDEGAAGGEAGKRGEGSTG